MRIQSQFIKLPGRELPSEDTDKTLIESKSYSATFWIAREDIRAVMETKNEQTGELNNSIIFTFSGDNFWCAIPAPAVMAIIDKFDSEALLYPCN